MEHPFETESRLESTSQLPALRSIRPLHSARILARASAGTLLAILAALVVVPWQQNIRGSGRVVAFEPYDRTQTIAAPVMGRVRKVWVIEGTTVSEGDPLLEIVDNDPSIVDRLNQQRASLIAALDAAKSKVSVYAERVRALEEARELAISSAEQRVEVAEAKVRSEEQGLAAANAAARQAYLNFTRQRDLYSEGLASTAEFEVADRQNTEAIAKVEQAKQALAGARNEVQAKRADLGRAGTEAKAKIDSARADSEAANVEVANKQKSVSELDVKISQQATQLLRAPRDGTVFRLLVSPGAELVKAGDPLLVLVPDTDSRAVELWIDGNDVPLVQPGRKVRVQFEGWPAVQFAGWPSVAVGTFGGEVALVDNSDDGSGRFRILIGPDPEDAPWPESTFLRQGAKAKGFVLLDQVSLGYEFWRQANGFPPSIRSEVPLPVKAGSK